MTEPKPDKSRLLADEEIGLVTGDYFSNPNHPLLLLFRKVAEAQRDLTASILKAQEQARVERLLGDIAVELDANQSRDDFKVAIHNLYHRWQDAKL